VNTPGGAATPAGIALMTAPAVAYCTTRCFTLLPVSSRGGVGPDRLLVCPIYPIHTTCTTCPVAERREPPSDLVDDASTQ
jgi:hypothetical protein